MAFSVRIQQEDFSVDHEFMKIEGESSSSGAVVFFVGLVRDFYEAKDKSKKVFGIELEHYPDMTESAIFEIIEEAKKRYGIESARVVHRIGTLYAGDKIVLVACASSHREAAFQAAQYIMDFLKTKVPIWKKEIGDDGEQWLGVKDKDKRAAQQW